MSKRSTNRRSRERGFTLIEVLAALAIVSVIIMSTAALMWNVTLFFDRGTRGVSEADRLVLAVDRLAADFGSARFAQRLTAAGGVAAAFVGQSAPGAQPAKLMFVSAGNVSTGPQGEEVVVLTVERSDDAMRLVRRRAPWLGPRAQFEETKADDPVALIEGNIDIRFSFGKVAPDGTLSWQDNWLDESTLPRFVRLILRRRDTGADLLGGAAFVVRSNAPPSCVTDDTSAQCLVRAAAEPTRVNQPQGAANASR